MLPTGVQTVRMCYVSVPSLHKESTASDAQYLVMCIAVQVHTTPFCNSLHKHNTVYKAIVYCKHHSSVLQFTCMQLLFTGYSST